jgi:hypothetical protein
MTKKLVIKLIITFVCTAIMFVLLSWGLGAFGAVDSGERYKQLSNSSFAIGVVFAGVGLLASTAMQGAFDGIAFSVQKFIFSLPYFNKKDMPKTYYDYKAKKAENPSNGALHLLIAGAFWVIMAVVFMLAM